MDDENIAQRLSDYSTRTNVNAMNIALVDQRMTITERLVSEANARLTKAENDVIVMKTVQALHDTQILSMRKILIGNGDRETIPMDLERLERNIQDILKVNWTQIQADVSSLQKQVDHASGLWILVRNNLIGAVIAALVAGWMATR